MKVLKVLATLDNKSARNLCKFLLMLVYGYKETIEGKNLVKLKEAANNSTEFLSDLGIKSTPIRIIVKRTAASGEVDDAFSSIESLCIDLKSKLGDLTHNNAVDKNLVLFMKHWVNYMLTDSEVAYNYITNNASLLQDTDITSLFIPETESQDPVREKLKKLVRKITKETRTILTADEKAQLKIKKPELLKQYNSLHNQLKSIYKANIRSIVRNSGKKLVDIKTVIQELDGTNTQHALPRGFVGKIDDTGALYTTNGLALDGGIPGIGEVVMNPDYDPKTDNSYVFTIIQPGKKTQYRYTVNWASQHRVKEKYEKVGKFLDNIDTIQATWQTDLKSNNPKIRLCAAAVEIVYITSARIGTNVAAGTADGKKTFGLLTLHVNNVKKIGNGYRLTYLGKAGVKQINDIKPDTPSAKRVIQIITELLAGKDSEDMVFTYKKPGTERIVRLFAPDVNTYLKSLGAGLTIKNFRQVRGSQIFKEEMEKSKIFKKRSRTANDVVAEFNRIVEKVATQLGHYNKTGGEQKINKTTSVAHYINPSLLKKFFDSLDVRYPPNVKKVVDRMGTV